MQPIQDIAVIYTIALVLVRQFMLLSFPALLVAKVDAAPVLRTTHYLAHRRVGVLLELDGY